MDEALEQENIAARRAAWAARRKLLFGRHEDLDRHLASVRSSLVDSIIKGLAVITVVGVPASLSRSLYTGWLPLYSAHLIVGAVALLLFAVRGRLSDRVKAGAVMAIFWSVGLAGLLTLGLAGAGMLWLVISSLLASVLYSIRTGFIVMGLVALALCVVGTAFCLGILSMSIGSAPFLTRPGAWITAVIGSTLMPVIVFQAIATLNASTLALLRKSAEQRELIRELATHDDLTGVPTLTLALDRLEQSLRAIPRSGRKVALLFIDLDGFKAINDRQGHQAGDSTLTTVARRLRLNLRAEDTVARIGGDEFLVILPGVSVSDEAAAIALKLQRLLAEPIDYGDQSLSVGASIGVAFATNAGQSAEDMIRSADKAMYEAKRAGGNQIRLAPAAVSEVDAQGLDRVSS